MDFQVIMNQASMELPTVMQNIGLALLTIFIPVALFLYEKTEEKDYKTLDKAIILDYLVDARTFLLKVALVFVPILFWDVDDMFELRLAILLVWGFGVGLLVVTLYKAYDWIRTRRFQYRFAYLRQVLNATELEDLWRSVWDSSSTNLKNEIEFFNIFSLLVDSHLKNTENIQGLALVTKLLNDFQIFVKNRSFTFLTRENGVFQKILTWHFTIWQREFKFLIQSDKLDQFSGYSAISATLDKIVESMTERALQDDFVFGFFKLLEKHIDSHKTEIVMNDPHVYAYVESIMPVFYKAYFKMIEDAKDHHDIWNHHFPKKWLITKENFADLQNSPVRVTLNYYMQWVHDRIKLPEKGVVDIDNSLEFITRELFPSVDPIFWATMITLLRRSWGEGRIQTLIEYPRTFGYMGRIYTSVFSGDIKTVEAAMTQNRNDELNNSINLILDLYPHEFTLEKLDSYINESKKLTYDQDSKELLRKNQIEEYLQKIKETVIAKNK